MRIQAPGIALEQILDHQSPDMGIERQAIGLAQAGQAFVCDQLDEQEIAPAKMRRRIADDKGLYANQLHALPLANRRLLVGQDGARGGEIMPHRPEA